MLTDLPGYGDVDTSWLGYRITANRYYELGQEKAGPIADSLESLYNWANPYYWPYAPAKAASTIDTFTYMVRRNAYYYGVCNFYPNDPLLPLTNSVLAEDSVNYLADDEFTDSHFWSCAMVMSAVTGAYRNTNTANIYSTYNAVEDDTESSALSAAVISRMSTSKDLVALVFDGSGSYGFDYLNRDFLQEVFNSIGASGKNCSYMMVRFSGYSSTTPRETLDFDGYTIYSGGPPNAIRYPNWYDGSYNSYGDGNNWQAGGLNPDDETWPVRFVGATETTPSIPVWEGLYDTVPTGASGDATETALDAIRYVIGWAKNNGPFQNIHIIHAGDAGTKFAMGRTVIGEGATPVRLARRDDHAGLIDGSPRLKRRADFSQSFQSGTRIAGNGHNTSP